MTASLIVVAVGAVAAAVGTAGLAARCSRAPGMFLRAWTVALFGLTVALAAQALGYLAGYSDLIFRCMDIAAQAVAPLFICLGLVELVGRSVVTRFAMRLSVAAIGVIVLVVLGSDQLNPNARLSTAWPDPAHVYQLVPVGLIEFLAGFSGFIALLAVLAALARSGRGPGFTEVAGPALIAGCAALAAVLPGAAMLAGTTVGSTGFALAGLLAAGLTWFAATRAASLGLAGGGSDPGDQPRGSQDDKSGRFETYIRPPGRHGYEADGDYAAAGYPDGAAHDGPARAGAGAVGGRSLRDMDSDIGYPALAALAAERSEPAAGNEPGQYDSGRYDSGRYDSGRPDAGRYDPGRNDPGQSDQGPAGPAGQAAALEPYRQRDRTRDGDPPPSGGTDVQPNLFGQITIYTLLEDRLEEFDRLTEGVVEQVRAREPGTLVYIVHAVPTAPMQRILYEVYQDRSAYDDHLAQPYMDRYLAERRSMVLATNAIELGLQQAKVSPLASYSAISDILSESGIDLTGVTGSPRSVPATRGFPPGAPGRELPGRELPASGGDSYGALDPGADRSGYDDRSGYGGWDAVRGEDGYR